MKVTVLCSDKNHAVFPHLEKWVKEQTAVGHSVSLLTKVTEVASGDVMFLVSCSEIVSINIRSRFQHVLVLHASDLPDGRGWSPHIWSIIEGASELTLCLLDASDPVDTGSVWLRERIPLEGSELLEDVNSLLFAAETRLMSKFLADHGHLAPSAQTERSCRYFRRRTPEDSRLDPQLPLADQFNLLRVVDNERYPAFFELHGQRYILAIRKASNNDE